MFSTKLFNKKESVLKEFNLELKKVSEQIQSINQQDFQDFNKIINNELEIITLNFRCLNYKNSDFSKIVLSICFKNIISIISSINLVKEGFLGSAKIIFRNVYESLIIGKFIGTTEDVNIFDIWEKGEHISLRKDIFQKISQKPSSESLEFWDTLNKYTHSTVFSQDFLLELDQLELLNCNIIIITLLTLNYYLLNNFVSKYYDYYLNYYFHLYYQNIKKTLKNDLRNIVLPIDPRCKKIINEYKIKWSIN